MGSSSSKATSRSRSSSSYGSRSSSLAPAYAQPYEYPNYQPPQQHYPPPSQSYAHTSVASHPNYAAPSSSQSYANTSTGSRDKSHGRYLRIADNYSSLEQVTEALAHAGLESSNLIVGIDFTKSNEWTGNRSFNRRCLHHIGDTQNPYEQAISIIGRTLSAFDEDNLIPCFGFGDASTHDQDVFSFYPGDRLCNGFEEALMRYREIVPHLRLAGPTSFAPIIEMAMTIVEQSGGQYHVLLIIADGQVTRSVDTEHGRLSPQEQKTVDAIVRASEYPLSIILVGVGDGPWDMMREFDDNIPSRAFDNFQFVNFTEIMSKNMPISRKETEFALTALMEIPSQYKATIELNILGCKKGKASDWVPLPPPPLGSHGAYSFNSKPSRPSSCQPSSPPYPEHTSSMRTSPYPEHTSSMRKSSYPEHTSSMQTSPYPEHTSSMRTSPYPEHTSSTSPYHEHTPASSAPPASTSWDNQVCPICLTNPKDMAFGCGHQTCCECGDSLQSCPICRSPIVTRIKLY